MIGILIKFRVTHIATTLYDSWTGWFFQWWCWKDIPENGKYSVKANSRTL